MKLKRFNENFFENDWTTEKFEKIDNLKKN